MNIRDQIIRDLESGQGLSWATLYNYYVEVRHNQNLPYIDFQNFLMIYPRILELVGISQRTIVKELFEEYEIIIIRDNNDETILKAY